MKSIRRLLPISLILPCSFCFLSTSDHPFSSPPRYNALSIALNHHNRHEATLLFATNRTVSVSQGTTTNDTDLLASPLSNFRQEKDRPAPLFDRSNEWLQEATTSMLETIPLGYLSPDDVEGITGLMVAWVRRRSTYAALTVESLLKRVVDDMRVGNRKIHVTTRHYTYAIDAWAKSGDKRAALRAQHIHEAMVRLYSETKDPMIEPTVVSYNSLVTAWGKSSDKTAPLNAEQVLNDMILAYQNGATALQPDAMSFSTMLDIYSYSDLPDACQRAEALFLRMEELGVQRNVYTFTALQNVYARSGRPEAAVKAMEILNRMQYLYEQGDVFAKPTTQNYNAILTAYSRCPSTKSAKDADAMLRRMELSVSEGGYDIKVDRLSYALAILACARCPDEKLGSALAEATLERMEAKACKEATKKEKISSAAPASVTLDIECFNVVLTAISRYRHETSPQRVLNIVRRMEKYADGGQKHVRPNIRTWNSVLNTFSRAAGQNQGGYGVHAGRVLEHIMKLSRAGTLQPNAFTFAAVLGAYQKSRDKASTEKADLIVRRMEEMYERGLLDAPPDVYHYTILCSAWAKSKKPTAPDRCLQILAHMMERARNGYQNVTPNVRTYNAVLDCLSRSGHALKAEELLYYMLHLYGKGQKDAKPDGFSFDSVIHAFSRSRMRGAGRRAEAVLERFIEFCEEEEDCRVGTKSFTHIILHYNRSKELDAPYRAEYLLNRMIATFKAGNKRLDPSGQAFGLVIDCYSSAAHPDAGRNADRLVSTMRKLKEHHSSSCTVTTTLMNNVLSAWANSGDEHAGHHAEMHLDDMEKANNGQMIPNTKSYTTVLLAWSRSRSSEKARRSLRVLRRLQAQIERGNRHLKLSEHACSLVINACAFCNGDRAIEREAFDIASSVLDEMLRSSDCLPSSITYGWFIQGCERLRISEDDKVFSIKRAFNKCCECGLVNDFVLQRLISATTAESLVDILISVPGSRFTNASNMPSTTSELQTSWTMNVRSRRKLRTPA